MQDINFDREQIQQAFPKYKYIRTLGKGAFGKVFLVLDPQNNQQLAVKKISCFGMCQYERNNAINQVRILASLDHENIIKFRSGMFDNNEDDLYLFMEYAAEGDLAMLIEQAKDKKKKISENCIWKILLQMAEGLQFLHKSNIIHRDIKPANIFRTSEGTYKIADLNVSKILANGDLAKTKAGSPFYVAPEVWNKEEGYNQKCDIWSLGIVAYELCCLKVPYQASTIEQLIKKQNYTKLKNIPGYSVALNELIHEMLQMNPVKRLSADRVRSTCMKNLKIDIEEILQPLDPLMNTIFIPETEQRWINLVPLPPKMKKDSSNIERKDSKQKNGDIFSSNRSNIFANNQNKSLLIPRSKNSQEKKDPLRLPSINRKNSCNESELKILQKVRQKTRERSKDKSRQKSRQNIRRNHTPEIKQLYSNKISRKY